MKLTKAENNERLKDQMWLTADGSWQRRCPICNEVVTHGGKFARIGCMGSLRNNAPCRSCSYKQRSLNRKGEETVTIFAVIHRELIPAIDPARRVQVVSIQPYAIGELRFKKLSYRCRCGSIQEKKMPDCLATITCKCSVCGHQETLAV